MRVGAPDSAPPLKPGTGYVASVRICDGIAASVADRQRADWRTPGACTRGHPANAMETCNLAVARSRIWRDQIISWPDEAAWWGRVDVPALIPELLVKTYAGGRRLWVWAGGSKREMKLVAYLAG